MMPRPHDRNIEWKETDPLLPPVGDVITKQPERLRGWGSRHTLTFWAFLGFINVYAMRVNLSVALVAMVNSTDSGPNNHHHNTTNSDISSSSSSSSNSDMFVPSLTNINSYHADYGAFHIGVGNSSSTCPDPPVPANSTGDKPGEFNWDEKTQGLILGAFFYGYLLSQIPGGWIATSLGGKNVFGLGILCTSVLTLLTPLAARTSLYLLLALRVVEGIGEGVTFPAMHSLLGVWAPVFERSTLAVIAYSGAEMGTVIAMPISGVLCDSDFLGGWPSVFYIFGSLGVLWTIGWMLFVYSSPATHPWIGAEEKRYIETSIGRSTNPGPIPWGKILTCSAVWALAIANFSCTWGFYMFLTCLPTYMKKILKFDMKSDSSLSALPYAGGWVVKMFSSFLGDRLRSSGLLSTKNTRKLLQSLGTLLPAGLVLMVGYVGCDHVLAVVTLTLCVGMGGFSAAGFGVNHLDIAPKFAGILQGFANSFGTVPGFVSPLVVGSLTNNNQTREQWQIAFYITAIIYVVGCLLYLLLAQGEVTSWGGLESSPVVINAPSTTSQSINSSPSNADEEHDVPIY